MSKDSILGKLTLGEVIEIEAEVMRGAGNDPEKLQICRELVLSHLADIQLAMGIRNPLVAYLMRIARQEVIG